MTRTALKDPDEEWLRTSDASTELGVSPRRLYEMIDHGEIAAYRHGRGIRLRAADIEAYRRDEGSLA